MSRFRTGSTGLSPVSHRLSTYRAQDELPCYHDGGTMPDVICLGILVADLVARPVDQFPERGRLLLSDEMKLSMGGCAANTATGLARMGIWVGVIGKVGDDPLGDFVTATLNREGVDTRGLVRDRQDQTSATMVFVHADGERSFIHCVGVNATISESDIDFELFKEA